MNDALADALEHPIERGIGQLAAEEFQQNDGRRRRPPEPQAVDRDRLTALPTDPYLAEAQNFLATWVHRLHEHDKRRYRDAETIGKQADDIVRLNTALAHSQAEVGASRVVIRELETEVQATRDREARALEQVGIMKGTLLSHGAAITDLVGKVVAVEGAAISKEEAAAETSGRTSSPDRKP